MIYSAVRALETKSNLDYHEGAELDEAPLKAIEELLESRGGNTACYAIGEWNEDELDPDCIFD